jgi:radical SAM superfamily enzyme YgiQ (UPF0313 family)
MKILLVLPAGERVRVTRESPEVPRRKMLRFSVLPLTVVAALTPARHEVALCDENVEPLDFDLDVDLVGITFMTALAPRAYAIAREFRRRGKLVVAGGYHPTLCTAEVLEHFDAVVVGEAEGGWERLLEDVEAGRLRPSSVEGGGAERDQPAEPAEPREPGKPGEPAPVYANPGPCDPAAIPAPRRELTAGTARHYVTVNAVQTGRGCSHGCAYCSVTAFHRRAHRSRPLGAVLDELAALPRDLMFVDDNLVADPGFARALFTAMKPMKKRWVGQGSLEIADDPDLLRLAREAGCLGLFVGIETLSRENLEEVGKAFNQEARYLERVAAIRRAGIGIVAGIIVGLDGDDPGVFERTLAFLRRAGIDGVQVNVFTPLPGTPMFDRLERAGRILVRDWSRYDFRHCVIRPARMTPEQLQDGADWMYASFYRLDRILGRFVRGVFELGPSGALLVLRLALTYRYDNRRERIVGRDPAARAAGRTVEARVPAS